ncbi:hypothetical protein BDV96DRAFT_616363 [Lophiotrema nucula]|uniref:Uncharacterized protein n=1 Tax=Lophiotrema nucula TaxID=690887 RepID=A0A6A5YMG3_9PLEO|nr:hypothetical protein BDV96DRAFT_616363 [Lophiotrema nucula]
MLPSYAWLIITALIGQTFAAFTIPNDDQDMSGLVVNQIPWERHVHYMRELLQCCSCPSAAFVVCEGANFRTGDPTSELLSTALPVSSSLPDEYHALHGEISAINACTAIYAAWGWVQRYLTPHISPLTRLTSAAEYIYGTTIQHNYNVGWVYDVFQQSRQLPGYQTSMLGQNLTNETDPLFSWQYNGSAPCPNGCGRIPSAARGGPTCSNTTMTKRHAHDHTLKSLSVW